MQPCPQSFQAQPMLAEYPALPQSPAVVAPYLFSSGRGSRQEGYFARVLSCSAIFLPLSAAPGAHLK